MTIEIITIGREILDGRVVDTNSAYLGGELSKLGFVPRYLQRVDDIESDIFKAFEIAAKRSSLVFVTGGLGPTSDDITSQTFAKFVSEDFVEHPEARENIKQAFSKMNRPIHDSQWKQGFAAKNAKVIPNPVGTAPAFMYQADKTKWFFLPGVPREMKAIFVSDILPGILPDTSFCQKMWFTHFTSEGELQHRLSSIISALPAEISFFYRTKFPENHLGISGALNNPKLKNIFNQVGDQITNLLGADVFSVDPSETLEKIVLNLAAQKNVKLLTVESCTGGLVASRLTDIPGSSSNFEGSFVTYSNHLKAELAARVGLQGEMKSALKDYGAVSEQVAGLMAMCASKVIANGQSLQNVLSVSTTGIAGPDGGSPDKPVGTCWIAVASPKEILKIEKISARNGLERDQLKLLFSQKALDMLRHVLLKA